MYRVSTSVFIHFAHHIRGHSGPCISLHGHTWRFELALQAETLDSGGFVLDFDLVDREVLVPCHLLLDHSLALGQESYAENQAQLAALGCQLVETRRETIQSLGEPQPAYEGQLGGARNEWPGGIKVTVFPFAPTSERLARWLYEVAVQRLADDRVSVACARVCETLHPVECIAEYSPPT
jgi:6-pyruvoyl-tetrahydropterin synthase